MFPPEYMGGQVAPPARSCTTCCRIVSGASAEVADAPAANVRGVSTSSDNVADLTDLRQKRFVGDEVDEVAGAHMVHVLVDGGEAVGLGDGGEHGRALLLVHADRTDAAAVALHHAQQIVTAANLFA